MDPIWRPAAAEFVGITFLVFAGTGSIVTAHFIGADASYVGLIGIAAVHAIALGIAVSATMNVSGGHLNPAITIAAYLTKKIDARTAGVYIGAQLLGAIVASAFVRATLPRIDFDAVGGGTPTVAAGFGLLPAVVLELILTFFLGFAIWGTAVSRHKPVGIAGFAIGLTIFFDIMVGGPFTGAAMNPGRALGPAVLSGIWDNHWVYWVGPVLGATLAAAIYEGLLEKKEPAAPKQ